MHKPDDIKNYNGQAGFAIINNHRPRPDVIMHPIGGFIVAEPGNPHRVELPVAVAVNEIITIFRLVLLVIVDIHPPVRNFGGYRHCCKSGFQLR